MAIMFALMVVMLMGVAALGTDLGNAWARKTDTQNQADFAAYDVAIKYPELVVAAPLGPLASGPLCAELNSRLQANQPQDDNGAPTINVCDVANSTADGHAEMIMTPGGQKALRVYSPPTRVDFGLAAVFDITGRDVHSDAAVGVFSPGPRILPMFAVEGCDYSSQTLIDFGSDDEFVPTLSHPAESGPPRLEGIQAQSMATGSWENVTNITAGAGPFRIQLVATQWNKTWKIGFFRGNGDEPIVVNVGSADVTNGAGDPVTPPYDLNGVSLNINVPAGVLDHEEVWWVRAWGGRADVAASQNEWSPVSEAQSLTVGESVLRCGSDSTSGNFGTLYVPRQNTFTNPTQQIPANIARGIDGPVLRKHPNPTANDGNCSHNDANGSKKSFTSPTLTISVPTNCVGSDTGTFTNQDAMQGLFTFESNTGLLSNRVTADGCGPNGGGLRHIDVNGQGTLNDYNINDDRLSCFLLDGKSLGDVDQAAYSGGPAFTKELFDSPRFAYVPVLKHSAAGGGTAAGGQPAYSIIDFRPVFITDETSASDWDSSDATVLNGIDTEANGNVHEINVFFFNIASLPNDEDVPVIDYLGVGKPIVHLID
jgi:Putative Flp pilus-assembly TadE/G-like